MCMKFTCNDVYMSSDILFEAMAWLSWILIWLSSWEDAKEIIRYNFNKLDWGFLTSEKFFF